MLLYFVTRNEELGRLIQQRLAPLEMKVVLFNAGTHLAQTIRRVAPHIVLLEDTRKEDILGLAAEIRQALGPPAGIVLISTTVSQEKVVRAVKGGVNRIVVYPFTFPALLKELVACCKRMGYELLAAERESSKELPAVQGRSGMLERLSQVDTVNTMPHVLQRVTQLTAGSEGSASDLEEVISADASASAVLIKRANAPVYKAVRRITRLRDCVSRIGFKEVRSLVLALALMEVISTEQKTLGFDRLEFWKASLATALLSREIAAQSGVAKSDEAFLCGLLADFGKLVLDEHLSEPFEASICRAHDDNLWLRDAANQQMELNHLDVGALTLKKWRFPMPLVTAVEGHEEPEKIREMADDPRYLATCVCLGKWLGLLLGLGDSGCAMLDSRPLELLEDLELGSWLTAEQMAPLIDELNDMLIPFKVRARSPFAEERGAPEIYFHELDELPVSMLELLARRAGGRPRRVSAEELERLSPSQHLVVHAATRAQLVQAMAAGGWEDRPYLLISGDAEGAPEGWPPEGGCQYISFPVNARRLSETMRDLAEQAPAP